MKIKNILTNFILPLGLFLAITFVFQPQLFTGFTDTIEQNDGRLLAWTISQNNYKILNEPLEIFQANIYYPNENTLTYSDHFIGGSVLALPVSILFPEEPIAAFNFLMILGYILNAFCAYLLIRKLNKNNLASIIGALIFAFCSYRVFNYGHLQNMLVFYMPLMLLFLYKYLEQKKIRYLIPIGICLLFQSLTAWSHMIFIFLLFGSFVLFYFWRKRLNIKDLAKFAGIVIIVLGLILPFALPYFEFQKENDSDYSLNDMKTYSSDLGGYLLPPPNTFVGTEVLEYVRISKEKWQENFNFIGYIALALSVVGLASLRVKRVDNKLDIKMSVHKSRIIFFVVGLIFVILSFGPFFRFDDTTTRVPLPYLLIYHLLPPLRFIRAVARYASVVYLMVGILSAFGVVKILNRLKAKFPNKLIEIAFIGLLGVIILFEYYPYKRPTEVTMSSLPEVYREIRDDDEIKAIVELPINVGPFETVRYIYYAGIHHKPIMNGYSGFEPTSYNYYRNIVDGLPNDIGLAEIYKLGVTHILINPEFKDSINSQYLNLQFEGDAYRLFEIDESISEMDYFLDKIADYEQLPQGINYIFNNSEEKPASSGTPIANISPTITGEPTQFTVITKEEIDELKLNFRSFSNNDSLKITCAGNSPIEFKGSGNYLADYLELDCEGNIIEFEMYSVDYTDRTMITSLGLIFK